MEREARGGDDVEAQRRGAREDQGDEVPDAGFQNQVNATEVAGWTKRKPRANKRKWRRRGRRSGTEVTRSKQRSNERVARNLAELSDQDERLRWRGVGDGELARWVSHLRGGCSEAGTGVDGIECLFRPDHRWWSKTVGVSGRMASDHGLSAECSSTVKCARVPATMRR